MRVGILFYGCVSISLIMNGMQKPELLPMPTLTKKVQINLPKTVNFTPNGAQVLLGAVNEDSVGQLFLYDSSLNRQICQFEYLPVASAVVIAPNSQTACISNEYGAARIVNITNGQTVSIVPDGLMPTSVDYNNDGSQLLMATPNGVYQLDVASNTLATIISGYCQSRVAYYKPTDNNTIAVTQEVEGSTQNEVQLYNIQANKSIRNFKPKPEPVYQLAFNSSGDTLVCGQVSNLSVWDTNTGQELQMLNGEGKLIRKPSNKRACAAQFLAFIPGKNVFFVPMNHGVILACDIDAPENNIQFGDTGAELNKLVGNIAVSPDGNSLLAVRALADDVCVWDISTLKKSLEKEKVMR